MARRRALFVFIDGVGLGPADPEVNPLARAELPAFAALLDGRAPVLDAAPYHGRAASLVGLDATLGVPGLPQSGTGQAALLTGRNAAALFGRHFGPWTPTALRPLVERESILARARAAGLAVAFANAYPEELVEAIDAAMASAGEEAEEPLVAGAAGGGGGEHEPAAAAGAPGEAANPGRARRRPRPRLPLPARIAPPLAARAAGLLTRHTAALMRGDAIASEITNDAWRERLGRLELPVITAAGAGRNLARIAAAHDLTFFAHYATDTAGHRGGMAAALAALQRVDAFLAGILEALPGDTLLLIASDHGNLEDTRTGHTRNPALCVVAGPGHQRVAARLHALTDVAPALLRWLGVEGRGSA
ncbi:MAG: alkaline phosphatase family protein [bacterium]|jgi:2,3-bisphosphoglycerate-independent phosphoglycerate mutase|nr:MAG: hypothetical protein DIU52_01315 [bacterium]